MLELHAGVVKLDCVLLPVDISLLLFTQFE